MIKIKRWHRWLGLGITAFLLLSVASGWILGHRFFFAETDLPRSILPKDYQYANWNNASIKGTIRFAPDSILMYGGSGVWLTDSTASHFVPFMAGIKPGADNRIVSRIIQTPDSSLFAATTFRLYRMKYGCKEWIEQPVGITGKERIADIETRGDTLVVLTRSHIFQAAPPYKQFSALSLPAPPGYNGRTGLFRFLWILHSGELFGKTGVWAIDLLGGGLALLTITGLLFFAFPFLIRHRKKNKQSATIQIHWLKHSLHWHNYIGRFFWLILLLMALTGAFLRPPLLITIIRGSVPAIPGTILADDNPWNDKLRAIRYDANTDGWLLYTSNGFYWLEELDRTPMPIQGTPPVSVMGIHVWESAPFGWLIGSFNGLYYWNIRTGDIIDIYAGHAAIAPPASRPVTEHPICGFSNDFSSPVVFEYIAGATPFGKGFRLPSMPVEISNGRISLWHVALEAHTGRIIFGVLGPLADIYVTLLGLTTAFLLLSGYILYRRRMRNKH